MITDKSRYGHDAVLDVNCGDSVQVLRTEPMTLTEQEQKIVQKYLGIALLERSYIDANGHLMVVLSDGRTLDVGSARGLPGATPYLGENGNWFVEGVDTLQSARGLPGFTPYIGENEHWWIDKTDTGIPARGIPLTEKADNTRFLRNDGTWQKVTPENIGAAKQSDFAAQKSIVSDHTTRIEALEQRTVTAPYYTDDSVAYTKEVPENALPFASVDMIGGMTRKTVNLIPFPYDFGESDSMLGVSFVANADGSVTLNGTYTGSYEQNLYLNRNNKITLPAGTYTISGIPFSGNPVGFVGSLYDLDGTLLEYVYGNTFTITETRKFDILLQLAAGASFSGETIYPMLNAGTEPLPYEPYFDGLRSAPVTEVESEGVNRLGGITFANAIKAAAPEAVISADDKTISYHAAQVDSKVFFADFKSNKQYTIIIKGFGSNVFANMAIQYTDGTTESFRQFSAANTVLTLCHVTNATKSVAALVGAWKDGNTTLYYDDCGIFEGVLTEADFVPYRRNTLPVPAEVQALDGYGWGINANVYNYIDWEKKQFVKRVERVDLGTLNWIFGGTDYFSTNLTNYSFPINSPYVAPLLCAKYDTVAQAQRRTGTISGYNQSTSAILVTDSDYTDAATFKTAMSGVMLYYELAEPVITDISDLLPPDNLIGVEGGGTVTMVNEYGYDVPSEITYARLTWQ